MWPCRYCPPVDYFYISAKPTSVNLMESLFPSSNHPVTQAPFETISNIVHSQCDFAAIASMFRDIIPSPDRVPKCSKISSILRAFSSDVGSVAIVTPPKL